ncbi:MAG: ribbon-helix-helix domain-containing protein [Deltaproteobacteria bacterium]|nr:ribbon-helix-helix domain-containing protein [Deltaproteobacteria bacterium]
MYIMMRRTQLYIDEALFRSLTLLSRKKKITVSELVRRAIESAYGRRSQYSDRLKLMESAFGIWKNRKDLPSTEKYLRSLRKDSRAKRLGLA